MAGDLVRFTVSIPGELVSQFDWVSAECGYSSRSGAVRDALRLFLAARGWEQKDSNTELTAVAAAICASPGPRSSLPEGAGIRLLGRIEFPAAEDRVLILIAASGAPAALEEALQNWIAQPAVLQAEISRLSARMPE